MDTPPYPRRPPCADADEVWNLAIGSNLSEATMRSRNPKNRRPIAPLKCGIAATVKDWALSFDLESLPPAEPAMAAAVPRPGKTLHGILYKLSRYDYETLRLTEGCRDMKSRYAEVAVEAVPYERHRGDESVPERVTAIVFALRYPPAGPLDELKLYPSNRYLSMMIKAAKDAELDEDYVAALERTPVARSLPIWLKGLSTFSMFGHFWTFKYSLLSDATRAIARPPTRYAHYMRELAHEKGWHVMEAFFSVILVFTLAPLAVVGFIYAWWQGRDLRKIIAGKGF